MRNPNCDGDKCLSSKGEVKVLSAGRDANLILCLNCFNYESAQPKFEAIARALRKKKISFEN